MQRARVGVAALRIRELLRVQGQYVDYRLPRRRLPVIFSCPSQSLIDIPDAVTVAVRQNVYETEWPGPILSGHWPERQRFVAVPLRGSIRIPARLLQQMYFDNRIGGGFAESERPATSQRLTFAQLTCNPTLGSVPPTT